jgi:hypothetical protein
LSQTPHNPAGAPEKHPPEEEKMKEHIKIKKIAENPKNLNLYLMQFVPLLKLKF